MAEFPKLAFSSASAEPLPMSPRTEAFAQAVEAVKDTSWMQAILATGPLPPLSDADYYEQKAFGATPG